MADQAPDRRLPDEAEISRRVRAARAYAGLTTAALADQLGIGVQTIKRIEAGRRTARKFELWAIAEACGLSRRFFELDFANAEASNRDLLERIDGRLEVIEDRVGLGEPLGHEAAGR